jgi:hypothetical protein
MLEPIIAQIVPMNPSATTCLIESVWAESLKKTTISSSANIVIANDMKVALTSP